LLAAGAAAQAASFSAPPVQLSAFQPAESFDGLQSFTPLGDADLFVLVRGSTIAVVLANGPIDTLRGTVEGKFRLSAFGHTFVDEQVTLHDGCSRLWRFGSLPAYAPAPWWIEHWQRYLPKDEGPLRDALKAWKAYTFNDAPYANPDQSGSARVCQFGWAGTMAALLGIRTDDVRVGALQWVSDQLDRPCLWYNASGGLFRAAAHPEVRVGQKGWITPKRPSLSVRQLETAQHLAPDRALAAAVAFGDPAAWFLLDAYGECILTWPEADGAIADDQRSHGYVIRTLALLSVAMPQRMQFRVGLDNALYGLDAAGGWAMDQPYTSQAPSHTGAWSHGYPGPADGRAYFQVHGWEWDEAWDELATLDSLIPLLRDKAVADKFSKDYYVTGPNGLWTYFRAVVVWQVGVVVSGLCTARDLGYEGLDASIRFQVGCILGPGRSPGIDSNGNPAVSTAVHDAYAARVPGRVVKNTSLNGTTTWLVAPLIMALPSLGPAHKNEALTLAKLLMLNSSYLKLSHPDGEAVETGLPGLALQP
jgi:hypothetical protein